MLETVCICVCINCHHMDLYGSGLLSAKKGCFLCERGGRGPWQMFVIALLLVDICEDQSVSTMSARCFGSWVIRWLTLGFIVQIWIRFRVVCSSGSSLWQFCSVSEKRDMQKWKKAPAGIVAQVCSCPRACSRWSPDSSAGCHKSWSHCAASKSG